MPSTIDTDADTDTVTDTTSHTNNINTVTTILLLCRSSHRKGSIRKEILQNSQETPVPNTSGRLDLPMIHSLKFTQKIDQNWSYLQSFVADTTLFSF